MIRTRLTRSKGLRRPGGPKGRAKGAKRLRANPKRRKKLFAKQFLSDKRVEFVRGLPCVCRGVGSEWGCSGGPCQNSHDPSRGAGGTYLDIHPATTECHRKLEQGAKTFWRLIGRTRTEANAETQRLWEESLDFLPSHDLP